jgi:pyruvate formate lyase activating enzyme
MQAAEIGCEEGLHYVYAGNLAGRVNRFENTRCPNCQTTLIKRTGYHLHYCKITKEGTCPNCHTRIAGIWN